MTTTNRSAPAALLLFAVLASTATPARARLYSLAAAGTISVNSSGDPTIPNGTPWSFELTYSTAAPDLDFELTTSPDPTYGRFTNTAAPPALTFFHYKAGSYEVTLDDPGDFGASSNIDITFTVVNAIDVNINAPASFPHLGGGPVSFHADFNAFSTAPIFSSDALPTNTALGPTSFDQSTVTLLPPSGIVSSSIVTSLTITAVDPSADFDRDGDVDGDDLTIWTTGFGAIAGALRTTGDANADAAVDGADFLIWQRQNETDSAVAANAPTGSAVPEPAYLAPQGLLLLLAAVGSARMR